MIDLKLLNDNPDKLNMDNILNQYKIKQLYVFDLKEHHFKEEFPNKLIDEIENFLNGKNGFKIIKTWNTPIEIHFSNKNLAFEFKLRFF